MAAPTHYEPTLRDYLAILRRRALHAGIAFALVFLVAVLVAMLLPPTYQAAGTILIESQQIPDDLIRSTVSSYADERILVIKQRVMTQTNLRKIIDKYDLFAEERKSVPASELLEQMRSRIGVELISADVVGNRKTTIAFKVVYDDKQPEIAYRVANELVTLFLDENVRSRTTRATETTEFLTQEADKLKANLEAAETQIAAYKQQHGNALPEHLELHMTMLTRADADLQEVDRAYKDAQAEARLLDIELSAAKGGLEQGTGAGGAVMSPAQQLAAYRTEAAKMTATYSPTHPDVRALKRKIEALEKSLGSESAAAVPSSETELAVDKVKARLAAAEARMASLAQQKKSLQAQRARLEQTLLQTPQVERNMTALLRDYENAKAKYQEVHDKQMSAQISENLEEEKKAERFALLEPPVMPDRPIKPNRQKLMAMGFFLALAGSGGMVMALEAANPRVRGAQALAAAVGRPPLVAIPYITTRAERARRKNPKWLWISLALAVLILGGAALAVHFLYQPLDLLMWKILGRFE